MLIRSVIKVIGSLLSFCLPILLIACQHEVPTAGPALAPTLSSIQTNIFTPKCVNQGCHPGGGAPMSLANGAARGQMVGIPSAYNDPQNPGTKLLRIKAGDANNSVLYLKVIGDARTGTRMPQNLQALSSQEVSAIQTWINNGAQNN